MKTLNTIVSIDCGMGGGIAVFSNGRAQAVPMPKDVYKMSSYLQYLNETYGNIIVFIEKVQLYGGGDDAPGKKFAIQKMLANYEQVLTVIKLAGLRYVEVYPITWQTTCGLKVQKIKGFKEESKTERKGRYKKYAQECFPEVKVNLKTSDALCLIQFALLKIQEDVDWIRERLQNRPVEQLFEENKSKDVC